MEPTNSPGKTGSTVFGQISGISKIRGALLGDLSKQTGSVIQGGLTDPENCGNLSKRLFDYYDGESNGAMSKVELSTMIGDVYKHIGRNYQCSEDDQADILRLLDTSGKGHVDVTDIEAMMKKYLC
jgi:hypothetical protein